MVDTAHKILIVDDEPEFASVLGLAFNRKGYDVDMAEDGEEGLKKLILGYPLFFTDFRMPRMDGVELIKKAREENSYRGVAILMSGSSREDLTARLVPYGLTKERFFSPEYCNDFVSKPFDIEVPLQMLKRYMPLSR